MLSNPPQNDITMITNDNKSLIRNRDTSAPRWFMCEGWVYIKAQVKSYSFAASTLPDPTAESALAITTKIITLGKHKAREGYQKKKKNQFYEKTQSAVEIGGNKWVMVPGKKKSRQATASSHNLKDWQRASPQMVVSKLSSRGTADTMRPETRGTLITNQLVFFFNKKWLWMCVFLP